MSTNEREIKKARNLKYFINRFKLGFQRSMCFWNPFMRYKYRKKVRHNKRVFKSTPPIINLIIISIILFLFALQFIDQSIIHSNPIFVFIFIFIIIFLFVTECWFSGGEDYIKYES